MVILVKNHMDISYYVCNCIEIEMYERSVATLKANLFIRCTQKKLKKTRLKNALLLITLDSYYSLG
jgi:hypothetical protein